MVVVRDRKRGRRHPPGTDPSSAALTPHCCWLKHPAKKRFWCAAQKLLFALANAGVAIATNPPKIELPVKVAQRGRDYMVTIAAPHIDGRSAVNASTFCAAHAPILPKGVRYGTPVRFGERL
jgi:hypothetical protein